MKRKKWTACEKLAIVMESLTGKRSVEDICGEYEISQPLYYRWRNTFLESGKEGLIRGFTEDKTPKGEIEKLQKIIREQAFQLEVLKKQKDIDNNKTGDGQCRL